MRKHTLKQKQDGELATRLLSDKAQEFYDMTSPIDIYEIDDNLYDVNICGDVREGITFQDIEDIFEDMLDEYRKEEEEEDD